MEARIGAGDTADQLDIVVENAWPDARNVLPRHDAAGDQVDVGLEDATVGAIEAANERRARAGAAGLEPGHHRLVGFGECHGLEHHAGAEIVRRAHERGGATDLLAAERIQRVAVRGCHGRFSLRVEAAASPFAGSASRLA